MNNVGLLTIFMLSIFVGFEVISKVSAVLHTPLMSGANAIHGVILVGAILITGTSSGGVQLILGLVAVVLATANMVGGFVVTDRMLEMFKGRGKAAKAASKADAAGVASKADAAVTRGAGAAVTQAAGAATDRPAS